MFVTSSAIMTSSYLQYVEKEVTFDPDACDEDWDLERSDRLQRKDTPHYKRDIRLTENTKPDGVIALLKKNQSRVDGW